MAREGDRLLSVPGRLHIQSDRHSDVPRTGTVVNAQPITMICDDRRQARPLLTTQGTTPWENPANPGRIRPESTVDLRKELPT